MVNVLNKKVNYLVLIFLILATKSLAQQLPEGFVYLKNIIPTIEVEMRYFSGNNFIGEQINGYSRAKAIVTKEAAQELKKIQEELEKQVKSRTSELEDAKQASLNILEDIEEGREKLKESYKKLKELDLLKTQFLSFASHELRTPLTPIRSQLQRMLGKELPKNERKDSLKMVLRNVVRLDKLINDVLDISRIESKRLKILKQKEDINKLINHVIETMDPFAKTQGIKIKTSLKKVPKAMFDKYRLNQVLINLIDNAIKHSKTKEIIIESKKKGKDVIVCVKDKGGGISSEEQKHLFELFFVGKEDLYIHKGAGLGLSICQGIIKEHDGKIWVNSKVGKGTTFCFSLPIKSKKLNKEKELHNDKEPNTHNHNKHNKKPVKSK